MEFENYKKNLCLQIYITDICCNNRQLAKAMFNYQKCKNPPCGIPDLLYLVSTSHDKKYLKERIKNYKGYSKFLEEYKNKILEEIK